MEVLPGCDPLQIIMDIGWSMGGMLKGWFGLVLAMLVVMRAMDWLRGLKPHWFSGLDGGMYDLGKDGKWRYVRPGRNGGGGSKKAVGKGGWIQGVIAGGVASAGGVSTGGGVVLDNLRSGKPPRRKPRRTGSYGGGSEMDNEDVNAILWGDVDDYYDGY